MQKSNTAVGEYTFSICINSFFEKFSHSTSKIIFQLLKGLNLISSIIPIAPYDSNVSNLNTRLAEHSHQTKRAVLEARLTFDIFRARENTGAEKSRPETPLSPSDLERSQDSPNGASARMRAA